MSLNCFIVAGGSLHHCRLLPVMKNMVGFKNIAVHEYQTLQLPITVAIITQHLGDFILFSSAISRRDVASPNG
ncbi:hypothetical protein BV349_05509 [Pseudomonas syringae pv. actinidiae]|nr:hypothetical protein BV349_05509 [Pseudomonas syringae pv. actinidiae]OSN65907.1 hypothetical protein BV351_05540 [Pseudomonas syringae pv. actinidiae]